jgi:hypothetical protein
MDAIQHFLPLLRDLGNRQIAAKLIDAEPRCAWPR